MLIIAAEHSEHKYSTSQIYNGQIDPAAYTIDAHNVCRIKDHVAQPRRAGLVQGWCEGERSAVEEMEKLKVELADCTGIVDIDENEVRFSAGQLA
jgi:hypothetical protein